MTTSDADVTREVEDLDDEPVAVTLAFRDWGRIVGSLSAMADLLDPQGALAEDVQRWTGEIRQQVVAACEPVRSEQEAANEDAN